MAETRVSGAQVRCVKHGRFIRRVDDYAVTTAVSVPQLHAAAASRLNQRRTLERLSRISRNKPQNWADRRIRKGVGRG